MATKEEIKEQKVFEKTLATTPEYKTFRKQGDSHDSAIWRTMKAKKIVPKAPFKDKAGKEIKLITFSLIC